MSVMAAESDVHIRDNKINRIETDDGVGATKEGLPSRQAVRCVSRNSFLKEVSWIIVRSICQACHCECGVLAYVKDDKVVKVIGY